MSKSSQVYKVIYEFSFLSKNFQVPHFISIPLPSSVGNGCLLIKVLILEILVPLHNNLISREVFFSRMSNDDNAENVQHHIVCFPTRVTESLRWRENEFIIEESIGHVIILWGFAIAEEEGLYSMNECGEQMNERYGLPLDSMNISSVLNYLKDYN